MHSTLGKLSRFAIAVTSLAALALTVHPDAALAAKGGNGGKNVVQAAGCAVNPNPVAVGATYTVSGSGFQSAELLNVFVQGSHSTNVLLTAADSSGSFSASDYVSWADSYAVSVYDVSGRNPVYLAGCSFQAQ